MRIEEINKEIFDEVCKIPVIDTHEHLPWNEKAYWEKNADVLTEYLIHYLSSDLISSGLAPEHLKVAMDPTKDIQERWKLLENYWELCRFTGYGRSLDIAVKEIYGIDGVHGNTIEELNNRFLESRKPGHMRWVLQELCGIKTSLLDVDRRINGESDVLCRVWQPSGYIMSFAWNECQIPQRLEKEFGISVRRLEDWLEALEMELDLVRKAHGMNVLKFALAYKRPLYFEKTDFTLAHEQFQRALEQYRKDGKLLFPRELQDFVMHTLLRLANHRGMTIQFHTGLLEGNGNILSNSNPSLLNNLFLEYPNIHFDLFHIGYPYQGEACALAKMFPNVTVNMCWAHIISPSACVAALHDFLDAIPYNKISAFGGDYLFPDGVYGHLYLSRQNVSRVLAQKVADGVFNIDHALNIAQAMYYDNPKRIFQLDID